MAENQTPHEKALPNYENALIPREKLERYCLDPAHESKDFGKSSGRDKARVFQAALGFVKADWELLKNRILEDLPYEEATVGHEDEHGTRYYCGSSHHRAKREYCGGLNSLDYQARNRFPVSYKCTMYEWSLIMPLISNKQRAFEGDVVELSVDVPKYNLRRGQRGVVITTFDEPSEAYDLELANESGDLLGFAYSIKPDQFTNLSRSAFVRAMKAVEGADLATAEKELNVATDLRPDYIGGFVMSVLASVPDPVKQKGFEDDVSYLIPLLRLATRVDPNYEFARVNLAIAFLNFGVAKARKKNYLEAIELFYSALGIKTDSETESQIKKNIVMAFTSLGGESFQNDRVEEGFGYLRMPFFLLQNETTRRNLGLAYGNLGIFYMKSERFDFAMQEFERAEDSGVVLPEYIDDYGVCLVFEGRISDAVQAFERVLAIAPQDEIAQFNLSKLQESLKKEFTAQELDTFANQFLVPTEGPIDFDGQILQTLAYRSPSVSTKEFAFA